MPSPLKASKVAFAIFGLGFAAVSVGATSPDYPDLGRGDQPAAAAGCDTATIDGIRVCAPGQAPVAMSVVTVAPGLTVVQ